MIARGPGPGGLAAGCSQGRGEVRYSSRKSAAGGVSADQANPLAGLFSGLASAIPEPVEVSGWLGMEQADVALALAASLTTLVLRATDAQAGVGVALRLVDDL